MTSSKNVMKGLKKISPPCNWVNISQIKLILISLSSEEITHDFFFLFLFFFSVFSIFPNKHALFVYSK